ncbi:MAG: sulfotransferase, partial [Alphaproteobacteria bacterium]|nr:sulfotransferase [Alphaproteobacteria bacterium]
MAIGPVQSPTIDAQLIDSIGSAVSSGDLRRAFHLANMALQRGVMHRVVFNAKGLAFQASGEHERAVEEFRRALALTPRDPTLLNAIALSLITLERYPEALQMLDTAIAVEPDRAYSHYRRGMAFAVSGDTAAAQAAYHRAVELDPNHAAAIASLASIAARKNDVVTARSLANRALALVRDEPTALTALAIADSVEGNFAEAEHRLRGLLTSRALNPSARAGILALLGDALDGQQRYAEAFAVYKAENQELRQRHAHRFTEQRGSDALRHIITYFESVRGAWGSYDDGGAVPGGPKEHVFLLGFMRSGTTLLEQVLGSNPEVLALEEKGTLNEIARPYMTSNEGLDELSRLDGAALDRDRKRYWDFVLKHEPNLKGKVFVDKQPLNTIKLPVIAKLFPRAKILFALRDPRDVVFSCFRRHFRVNVTMFEFLELQDAAQFYASVMRLAELCRAKLPLNLLEHRYEAMVEDFDGRVK